jgi:hypothetical protein
MPQPCDTCGDGFKDKNRERDSWRQKAQLLANEQKKSFSVCKENGSFAIYEAFWARSSGQQIIETVSGLPGNS